jgi:hypothetical protein
MTSTTDSQLFDPMPALVWNLVCRMLGPIYTEVQPHSVSVFDWSQVVWDQALGIAREHKPLPQVQPPRNRGLADKSQPSPHSPDIGAFEL